MNKNFSLLAARNLSNDTDINLFEKEHSFQLPPIYRLFVETFYLGEDFLFPAKYYTDGNSEAHRCESYNYFYNEENIGLVYFLKIEDAFSTYSSGLLSDRVYGKKQFQIAASDGNGLYVGTVREEADKIFWDRGDATELKLIANNIFEFVRNLRVTPIKEEYLMGGVKYSDFYKSWGDEFWSIKK